ncbi:hypothetical protein [Laribacter hongkongensis]|uniref:hypothetical protein n=1 Tax=Laribacter hongkongensis TaxID=168471 RepID=UPI0011CC035F|nr:hypothetical protein [Laribacter hongkongensis]MCG9040255.1 hypothetical protein [Laribacter hongkongensis]MCG9068345.1 hypothetical protein [Laribacter hongkongensis]MCG9088238.1 hypothetical protein [Laribacter hongkongensis]MCG9108591.1 hypothetical protein [Laribacter hongkongensis]MCG9120983.1 hypothetical protein [Laribacter hongkongensis]
MKYPLIDRTVTEVTHARFCASAGMKGSPGEQGTATTMPVHAGRTSTVNALIIHGIKLARQGGHEKVPRCFWPEHDNTSYAPKCTTMSTASAYAQKWSTK